MNTKATLNHFEETVEHYLNDLEGFSMEKLTQKPDVDQWSLGQLYMHLIQSALYLQLRNVEACQTIDIHTSQIAEKTETGRAIFTLGSFPPIAIHVPPSAEYTPQQPESKEQIRNGLDQVISKMRELEPLLAAISLHATREHPRLGALNAKEWYTLVEMHYRHHLLQLNRLK